MSSSNLIIDFGRKVVTAGIFDADSAFSKVPVTASIFSASAECGDGEYESALGEVLGMVREAGHSEFKSVALGVPAMEVYMRVINTPIMDKKKIEAILPLELSDSLIADTSDLKFDSIRLSEDSVLGAAVEKGRLRYYIDMLVASGVDPSWITVSLFSRDALLRDIACGVGGDALGDAGVAAFMDTESLTVVRDGKALFFKELTGSGDLALSIETLSGDGVSIDVFYATREAVALCDGLGISPITADALRDNETGIMAMAARMREGLSDAFNFRTGAFGGTLESNAVAKGSKLALLFIALLIVSWGLHAYLRNKTFEIETAAIDSEIAVTYKRLFKSEVASDPVYMLEAKLAELKRLSNQVFTGVDVLGVMREISAIKKTFGGKTLKMIEFSATPASMMLKGEAATKEDAEKFKSAVSESKAFKGVTIDEVKPSTGGAVTFNIKGSVEKAFFLGGGER